MNVAPQVRFWVAAAVALALVLWFLGSVLTPFAAGMALGYVLDPFATRLERLGLGRLGATILILVLFAVGFGVLLVIGAPILGRQLAGFVANMPATLDRLQTLVVDQGGAWLRGLMDGPLGKLGIAPPSGGDIQQSVGKYFGDALQWAAGFLRSVLSGGATLFNVASLLVVTPVVAFYMLLDWRRMVTTVDGWLPLRHRDAIRGIFHDIDRALAGFIRGQTAVCLILGAWYGIGLSLAGLNFGLLIGVTAGFLSFIPYVGSLTALILAPSVAIVQGWPSWGLTIACLGVVLSGQFLEGNVLSPKLVGEAVGLHPVWVMFALFAFGALFGFIGLLVAVPVAAAAGVLARFALREYLSSPLYTGHSEPADE